MRSFSQPNRLMSTGADVPPVLWQSEKVAPIGFAETYSKSQHGHRFGDFGYISLGREGRAGEFRYTLLPRAIGATVSAGALHAQGWGFESLIAHQGM